MLGRVSSLLIITKLNNIFTVFDSVDEAKIKIAWPELLQTDFLASIGGFFIYQACHL